MLNLNETWQNYLEKKDKNAKKLLIEYYFPYAIDKAKKAYFVFRDLIDHDELMSNAGYEVIKAIEKFDPDKSPKFLPYLYKRINWIIIAMTREADHLSQFERMLINKYSKMKNAFFGKINEVVDDNAICEKLGITPEKLNEIKHKDKFPNISINSMEQGKLDNFLANMAISIYIPTPNEIVERKEMVKTILDMLTDRYRQVFILRYLNGLSMAEISSLLGMTIEGIESVLRRQKKRLHDFFVKDDSKPVTEHEIKQLTESKEKRVQRLLKKKSKS